MPATIKIALDCRDVNVATTGTHTYLTELIAAFAKQHTDGVTFIFIKHFMGIMPGNNAFSNLIRHFQFFWWKQITLPILTFFKGADILICTDYVAPIFTPGFKTMVVFHDAFFWELPQYYNAAWLRLFKAVALAAAKKVICVVAPSHFAKKQIALHTSIRPEKIKVVYEAPKTFVPLHTKQSLTNRPYFLHVGTLAKHKNLPKLIEAFAVVAANNPSIALVMVGGAPTSVHNNDLPAIEVAIQKHQLQNQIILTGYVSSSEVANWYTNALGYVFPSVNEGFGLPILEAMYHGIPIVASNNTCLPEIGQAGALYFDPYNALEIASIMTAVINREDAVVASVSAQQTVLQQFSWDQTARHLVQIATEGLKSGFKHA